MKLDVLAIGYLIRDGTILDAHSTSTMIRTDDEVIVVDTSTKHMLPSIRTSLKQIGVLPKDVTSVVLTHAHHDHCGNNDLFKKAKIYVHTEERMEGMDVIAVSGATEIASGVRIVHTPGHTKGSVSVFAEGDRRYAIAGDAVPLEDNVIRMIPPGINYDAGAAMQSIKSITEYADVIVPGHGPPFLNTVRSKR